MEYFALNGSSSSLAAIGDSHPSLFPGRPRCRTRDHPQTRRSPQPWLHPRSRLNITMQETTGAETVTSPLVPCLTFSHTCTAKRIERFVKGFLSLSSVRDFVPLQRRFDSRTCTVLRVFAPSRRLVFSFSQTLDPYDRPWASTPTKIVRNMGSEEKQTKPAKGTLPER